jgi:TRAP-type C4-dicarboxylate transport system substrate-binding protein
VRGPYFDPAHCHETCFPFLLFPGAPTAKAARHLGSRRACGRTGVPRAGDQPGVVANDHGISQSNISGIGLATFAKLVSAHTDGRLTATIAYDNELKIVSADMPRAVQELRITGGDAFAGALARA